MNIYDIVASSLHNCLYICDSGLNVVHRYNLSNNDTIQWKVGAQLSGLSLTKEYNVLVSLSYDKQLHEYTPDGLLVENVSLENSLEGV